MGDGKGKRLVGWRGPAAGNGAGQPAGKKRVDGEGDSWGSVGDGQAGFTIVESQRSGVESDRSDANGPSDIVA